MLDVVRRTAEACFMPLTVGGGVRTVDDIRSAAAIRRRQGFDQQRRGQPSRIRQGGGREVRRSVHRGRDRRQAREAWRRRASAGRSSPMAAAIRPASMPSNMPRKWFRSAPVKSCSLSNGPRRHPGRALTFRSRVRWPTAFRSAGDRIRRRRPSRPPGGWHPPRACDRGAGGGRFSTYRGIYHTGSQGPYGPGRTSRCGSIPDDSL